MKIKIVKPFGMKFAGGRHFFQKDDVVDSDNYPEGYFDAVMEVGHATAVIQEPPVDIPVVPVPDPETTETETDSETDPNDGGDVAATPKAQRKRR